MRKYLKFITKRIAILHILCVCINIINIYWYFYIPNGKQEPFMHFTIGLSVYLILWELPYIIAKRFYRSKKISNQYVKLFSRFFSDNDIPLQHKHEYFTTYSEMARRDMLDNYEHHIQMCDKIISERIYSRKKHKSKAGECAK